MIKIAAPLHELSDEYLLSLSQTLISQASKKGITIATAESCSGGWIGKCLTDMPGSSAVFLGGIISYSNPAKANLLSVPNTELKEFGAVSEPVAKSMAIGSMNALKSTFAISVTGIAGPNGGSVDKPVGMVCFGLAQAGKPTISFTKLFEDQGRDFIRRQTVYTAIKALTQAVQET